MYGLSRVCSVFKAVYLGKLSKSLFFNWVFTICSVKIQFLNITIIYFGNILSGNILVKYLVIFFKDGNI